MNSSDTDERKALNAKERRLVGSSIKIVDRWIRGISDPDLGDVGKKLLAGFKKNGCRERVDLDYKALACYSSFSYRKGQKGFLNTILYGPFTNDSLTKLFSAKVHEITHVLQVQKAPILHADPFNPATRIIVCPRDWITLQERCEEDAYVNQALFNSLFMKAHPDVPMVTDKDTLSVSEFDEIRAAAPDIGVAFNHAARQSLNKRFYWNSTNDDYFSFRSHYQYNALDGYRAGLRMRAENKESGFVFVRITPEDIMQIGSSFGLNKFSGDEAATKTFFEASPLRNRAQEKLAALNAELGITDEDQLPTLTEALEAAGMDIDTFMLRSTIRKYEAPSAP